MKSDALHIFVKWWGRGGRRGRKGKTKGYNIYTM